MRRLLFFLSILSLSSSFLLAQGSDYVVQRLDVRVERSEIDENIVEAVTSMLKTRANEAFSQEDFDEDLKVLARDFLRVDPQLDFHGDEVTVSLRLWPKPQLRRLEWEGNELFTGPVLRKELGLKHGSHFDRTVMSEALHRVKAFYVKKGFFEVSLTYESCIDELSNEIDITIHVDEGRCGSIRSVQFVNFTPAEEADISNLIATKAFSFFTSWLTGEGTFQSEMTEQDRYIILNYMQNRGFADARVEVDIQESETDKRLDIVITLDRGPRYRFDSVTFSGNTVFDDSVIQRLMTIRNNSPFSIDGMRDSVKAISDFYGKKGYIDAYVTFQPVLRLDRAAYDVHFEIHEEEQYRVGMIKVYGNTTTHPNVILNECLLVPGEVFNRSKLELSEIRLRNVGYFECVNVFAVQAQDEDFFEGPRFRDVHIEVLETSTGDFGFSAGYSSSESAFIGFHFTERNFDIRGVPSLWSDGYAAVRGGGQYLAARANFGAQNSRYVLSWTEPYFRNSCWSLGIDVDRRSIDYSNHDKNGYEVDSYGFSIHSTRPINQFLKFGLHYRIRHSNVDISQVDSPSNELRRLARNEGIVSGVGASLIYDSTNHPLLPTCGVRSRLSAEYMALGGTHNFAGLSYFNSLYYSPSENYVVKLRADVRFLQPFHDTNLETMPTDELLFLGGESSVRGFGYNMIGPLDDNAYPTGGLSLGVASLEYVWKPSCLLDLFTFVDVGCLSPKQWTLDDWELSVGYGARLYVFGGTPVTLGYGVPIGLSESDKTKREERFFISLGSNF